MRVSKLLKGVGLNGVVDIILLIAGESTAYVLPIIRMGEQMCDQPNFSGWGASAQQIKEKLAAAKLPPGMMIIVAGHGLPYPPEDYGATASIDTLEESQAAAVREGLSALRPALLAELEKLDVYAERFRKVKFLVAQDRYADAEAYCRVFGLDLREIMAAGSCEEP